MAEVQQNIQDLGLPLHGRHGAAVDGTQSLALPSRDAG